jgi:hypothetical protein
VVLEAEAVFLLLEAIQYQIKVLKVVMVQVVVYIVLVVVAVLVVLVLMVVHNHQMVALEALD